MQNARALTGTPIHWYSNARSLALPTAGAYLVPFALKFELQVKRGSNLEYKKASCEGEMNASLSECGHRVQSSNVECVFPMLSKIPYQLQADEVVDREFVHIKCAGRAEAGLNNREYQVWRCYNCCHTRHPINAKMTFSTICCTEPWVVTPIGDWHSAASDPHSAVIVRLALRSSTRSLSLWQSHTMRLLNTRMQVDALTSGALGQTKALQ